jgi:hypothetical protein
MWKIGDNPTVRKEEPWLKVISTKHNIREVAQIQKYNQVGL